MPEPIIVQIMGFMLQSSAMMSNPLAFNTYEAPFSYITSLSTLSFSVRIWDIRSLASFVVMPTRSSVSFKIPTAIAHMEGHQ